MDTSNTPRTASPPRRRRTLATAVVGLLALAVGGFSVPSAGAAVSPGTVAGWGWNDFQQTTAPSGLSGVTAIAAGEAHSLALKNDGTVIAWGRNTEGQATVPADLTGVTAIAARGDHSLALKSDGIVVAWGSNNAGEATVPAGLAAVTAIAAGWRHSLALQSDGTVAAWGRNTEGQATVPADLTGVTAIAAGGNHSLALRSDGTVVAWGDNGYSQTDVPPGLSGVTAIAAGGNHSLAVKSDGTVVAWGDNGYSQTDVPPGLAGVTAIAGGNVHSVALKGDGTVVAWGYDGEGTSTVPAGLTGVTAIAAGGGHSLALVPTPLEITTATLPDGRFDSAYPATSLQVTGGAAPWSWRVSAGALPPGMALSPVGVLSGTPTAIGSYAFSVTVTESGNAALQATRQFTLRVNPGRADVAVALNAWPKPVQRGQTLTYKVTVVNHGPATARGIKVTDVLPPGTTFLGVNRSPSIANAPLAASPATVTITLTELGPGKYAVFTFRVRVTTTNAGITNTARVTDNANTWDPAPSNNTATIWVKVI